jgi:hypothetical protein
MEQKGCFKEVEIESFFEEAMSVFQKYWTLVKPCNSFVFEVSNETLRHFKIENFIQYVQVRPMATMWM